MQRRRKPFVLLGIAVVVALAPRDARAQVFTPSFLSPERGSEAGVFLSGGFGPSGDLALEAVRRREHGPFDLGFRVGIGDTGSGVALLFGADYRNPVEADLAPLRVAATGGAQIAVGSAAGFGVDAGVSVGASFASGDLRIAPYLHPRVALVETLRAAGGLDLAVLADLGVDLQFAPNLIGRLALGLGEPTAHFSIGLAWR